MVYGARPKPGVLKVVTAISLILSVLNVVWVVVIGAIALLVGAGSWLAGPAAGFVGSSLAAVVLLVSLVHSLLSVLLFIAGWKTWEGAPAGRSYHLGWAWIIVVLDLVDLAFTGGMEPGAWLRLIYAVFLIYVMNQEPVRFYFDAAPLPGPAKPTIPDEWS